MVGVNHVLKLGTLQIPASLLVFLVGLLISIGIVAILTKKRGSTTKEKWSDFILTHLLVFLFVYKFGWIIFDLKEVIENPWLIFWVSSSSLNMAIIVTIIVFVYKTRKSNYNMFEILDNLYVSIIIIGLIYTLFIIDYGKVTESIFGIYIDKSSNYKYHPINWYRSVLAILLIFLRYKWHLKLDFVRLMELYILLGVGLLLISIFDVHPNLIYGFSLEQWIYIFITVIGSIGLIRYSNKNI